jgi:hypothetical protein
MYDSIRILCKRLGDDTEILDTMCSSDDLLLICH